MAYMITTTTLNLPHITPTPLQRNPTIPVNPTLGPNGINELNVLKNIANMAQYTASIWP